MKAKPKRIKIDAEFNDFNELKFILTQIHGLSRKGNDKIKKKNFKYEIEYFIEPRIEVVNEIECIIIPSKINL